MGRRRPPSATTVTPEPPVNVVKSAHKHVTTTARPPGIQPNQAWKKHSKRVEAWLSART